MKSVYTCGSVSDGATTNFVNPSFPKSDTTAARSRVSNHICTFLLKIPNGNEDICQVIFVHDFKNNWDQIYVKYIIYQSDNIFEMM